MAIHTSVRAVFEQLTTANCNNDVRVRILYTHIFIVRISKKGNSNLRKLLKALYNYHLAAKAL